MPTFSPTLPRRYMPRWLSVIAWLFVVGAFGLVFFILFRDYQNKPTEMETRGRILREKAAGLINGFEGAAETGLGLRWTDEVFQMILGAVGDSKDIVYLALCRGDGSVIGSSEPKLLGQSLFTPEDTILPGYEPQSRLTEYTPPEGGETIPVFQVYQALRVEAFGHHRRKGMDSESMRSMHQGMTGMGMAGMGMRGMSPLPQAGDAFVFFVAYNADSIENAIVMDRQREQTSWIILTFILFAGFAGFLLVRKYEESRRAEAEANAFSVALIKALPVGILAIDQEGHIHHFNPEAARLTGIPTTEAEGKNALELLPALFDALPATWQEEPAKLETRVLLAGKRIPLEITTARMEIPVLKGKDTALGQTLILRDLGEIRRLEAEIRRQERLVALGNMAAGVAHEIRNPLGTIKGLARFFREASPPESEEARVALIMDKEVDRLDRVVGDLLTLARPDVLNLAPVDPYTLFSRVQSLVQAKDTPLQMECDIPAPCPPILGDTDRLTQVFFNLALNALEAGATLLRIRWTMPEHTGDMLEAELEDNGAGMPKEALAHIFSPYYTTKASGTGLGLSIVHKIIEAHDGQIEAQSSQTAPSFTRFTIRLPLWHEKNN